jgi:hypothetical protein
MLRVTIVVQDESRCCFGAAKSIFLFLKKEQVHGCIELSLLLRLSSSEDEGDEYEESS